ncbi:MAG: 4Fe-4S ferredoxin [Campylobacter sp.]|nr:4Fe-4S ferredoxin [Campylobacter sp.]
MQNRREFFNRFLGAGKTAPKAVTPPYFSGEFDCMDCQAPCVGACERELLSFEDGKIVFKVKNLGCNFCEACAVACDEVGRKTLGLEFNKFIKAKVSIEINSCLSWNDTICYNCQDACKFRAIEFLGVFRPTINDKCTACGECLSACFKNSLKMEAL